jgi:lysophospholipase L1-like esterase
MPTDSAGNTWTPLAEQQYGGSAACQLFYCAGANLKTSGAHTFSVAGTNTYAVINVMAFSGTSSSPFDQQNGTANNFVAGQANPGSITPTSNGALIITGLTTAGGTPYTVSPSGFTVQATGFTGTNEGGALAYMVQNTAAPINPTWSFNANPNDYGMRIAVIASFLPFGLPLTSGTASSGGATQSTLNVACTAATGGVSPYTYQWYRSTTAGFTPGPGNILAGQTSLSFTDSGLTPGTTYYYTCVVTDSVSSTANSSDSGTTLSGPLVLTAGTASFTSATTSTITLACTAASGGGGSYTYAWQRSTDAATWASIPGATGLTVTDAPAAQSLPYAYRLRIYDGTNTIYSNVVWGALAAPSFTIGWIGDSIWGVLNGGVTTGSNLATQLVPTIAQANLEAIHGPRTVTIANAAISGSHTADWLPAATNGATFGSLLAYNTASCYANALACFAASGLTTNAANQYIMIMLGANDAAEQISQAAYQSNLSAICSALLAAYPNTKIILNYPGVTFPGFDQYLPPYWYAINALVNGTTILLGDSEFPAFCADNRAQFTESQVHPNLYGSASLGQLYAQAVSNIVDTAAAGGGGSSGGTSTDPGIANVRAGTAYEINGAALTGACAVPMASQVLAGVSVGATTGNVVLPTATQVVSGVAFGPNGSETGTASTGGEGSGASAAEIAAYLLSQSLSSDNFTAEGTLGAALRLFLQMLDSQGRVTTANPANVTNVSIETETSLTQS